MIPTIPITRIQNTIESLSQARQGRIEKLPLGSAAFYHTEKPVLASNALHGTMIYKPTVSMTERYGPVPSANFKVETFVVCVKKKIRYDQMEYLDLELDKMARQFATLETTEVLKRIKAVDDVVFAPEEEVVRLQKFFDDLSRPVAVLRTGKVIDMGDNFTLVVRTDLCAEVFDEPVSQSTIVAVWEDIGFFCELS